ncbi:hypothetical protein [Actinophytocola gossypii]|uniref:DUF4350 domain-containing protein n=1 Tax=Actinophytocola gossypii TaxID=2812003 RepID=A0ABT2J9M3_9PSEU|nr:hypothetical protein [Actinophytocola gossypii]MCT2584411.1 hypothetical protein [Actinophytocola gossypii]
MRASTRKRIGSWLNRDHWGIPHWVLAMLAIGVLLGYLVFGREVEEPHRISDRVRAIAEGLRTTSVYEEEPGVPGVIDPERARELLGDRPIVLVLLDDTPLPEPTEPLTSSVGDLCDEIASVVTTSLVVVYATIHTGEYDQAYCTGPQFSNPDNPVDADNYNFGLIGVAELAWQYRTSETDRFPEVEEFVYAFDAQAREDYPDGVPTRAVVVPPPPTPDALQTRQVVLSLGGLLLAPVALFALLRFAGGTLRRRDGRAARRRTRQEAAGARLSALADAVLHPPEPADAATAQRQADLAGRYTLLLGSYEDARTDQDLDDLEAELTELETALRG